jgi:dTDP-glucose 4,6-dehydratase
VKKKILLTGCAGFIGSNFVKSICTQPEVSKDYDFLIIDALTYAGKLENIQSEIDKYKHLSFLKMDIRNQNEIQHLFQKHQFNGCMNFAAESHVDRSIETPNIFLETNVMGTLNLLNASLKLWNENKDFRYHQVSTDEVYGSLGPLDPLFTEETPLAPNSPYSASKASADLLVRSFHKTFGLPTIVTRSSNNYGPYQYPEKFIPVILMNAFKDKRIPVYGNGMNIRDWIFVDDHTQGLWLAFTQGIAGSIYNLGGDQELSNLALVQLILDTLQKPHSLIDFVNDRKGHDFRYGINNAHTISKLGWRPKWNLSQGLSHTINWYRGTYNF